MPPIMAGFQKPGEGFSPGVLFGAELCSVADHSKAGGNDSGSD